jgi:transcriptional accessory protein Tex/SPT6
VAKAVVRWREANGAFKTRKQLMDVSGLGAKTFEQSAGFLRIRGGDNPLDMTGVHPETYPVVEKIMASTGKPVADLMGRADMLKTLKPELFANDKFGVITVKDILAELEKPGRDPRPDFKVARFNDGVDDIKDLREGMVLEGTVSNVAQFGAFIDLGVHQDGLVHVSQLSHKFVTDAREVVKTGDIVRVKVMEVDVARKRIGLSMKLDAAPVSSPLPASGAMATGVVIATARWHSPRGRPWRRRLPNCKVSSADAPRHARTPTVCRSCCPRPFGHPRSAARRCGLHSRCGRWPQGAGVGADRPIPVWPLVAAKHAARALGGCFHRRLAHGHGVPVHPGGGL